MGKIRLLAIIDHLGGGGAERQFLELVKRIDRERFEVRVFLTAGGGVRLKEAREAGVDVVCPWEEPARHTPRAVRLLYGEIGSFKPDVVMAWLSYSITLTAFAAFLSGHKRLVFSERSSLEYLFDREVKFGRIKKSIFKRAFGRAPVVVTNSRAVADEFAQEGYARSGRISVVQNGVDLERFDALPGKAELRARLGLNPDKTYGIYAGKVEERKGMGDLMDALDGIPCPEREFLIAGEGGMESAVKGRAGVSFLGYRTNAVEYIKASDFLVLPSLYEGLPNVVLEAMAVGTAVVSTRVSGVPEVVRDGVSGLLVPPSDPAALRSAIERVCADPALRGTLAKNARSAVERLGMGRMVAGFQDILEGVARTGTAA